MKYNFDEIVDRSNTNCSKYDNALWNIQCGYGTRFDAETVPMDMADMDFRCSEAIKNGMRAVVEHNLYGYTFLDPVSDCGRAYYDSVIRWFKSRDGLDSIQYEDIIYVNGAIEALKAVISAFTEEGSSILVCTPVYSPFLSVIREMNRTLAECRLKNNDGYYTIDFEEFEKQARHASLFILCSPHNPVGRCWSRYELSSLLTICRKYHVPIFSDEVHGDITRHDIKFQTLAAIDGSDGMLICTTVGKTFNLAALQVTNVLVRDPALREKYRAVAGNPCISPFAVHAVIEAYNNSRDWYAQCMEYIDANIDWIIRFFKEQMPKVTCCRPEATYIIWADFRRYGISQKEIEHRLYDIANVTGEPGFLFTSNAGEGDGFIRFCIAVPRSVLRTAFERVKKAFEDLE